MTEPHWPQVRRWFEAAIARDGAARAAYLDALAGPAADVAAARVLVAAHEAPADFLDRSPSLPVALGGLAGSLDADAPVGARFGRYRLERVLGEGGMGVVYLATHDEGGLRRPVALKVARAALAVALGERFAAERDILARLAHPNIAHLYDGGVAGDGRPYLVMEYVDGAPITAHCAARGLGTAERLALVQTVCRAVDHAHRHLVVHRDIKPSNILVTDDGVVKLLDFGVAKVLGPVADAPAGSPPTLLALTPAYAAPEQFRRERPTTATDVYGLGAVAYELVSGRRPHAVEALSPSEAERLITTVPPGPPSGARRPTDLDLVLLKALRADPAERYATPGAFADDLQRALAGRPVAARAPTARYRVARFVRRHSGRVAAVAGATVALVAAAGLAVHQAHVATALARREQAARARAEAERARSELATRRAERINRFLQGVLATANPGWYIPGAEKGPNVTVLRALELAAARMERDLADDPETRADIHHTLGDTYRVLGRPPAMRWHFERALALRERVLRPPHPKLADGLFYAAVAHGDAGHWDASDSLSRAALAMQRARDEGNNLPYLYEHVAGRALRAGDFAGADTLNALGLAVARARYPATHPLVRSLSRNRARALARLGRADEAWALAAAAAAGGAPAYGEALAQLAAEAGARGRADSLFRAAAAALPDGALWREGAHLERARLVLVPAGRWAAARAVWRAQRPRIAGARRQSAGAVVTAAAAAALGAEVSLGEGDPARAAGEARAALALMDSARAGARYDAFWEPRVLARSTLVRAEVARGRAAAARAAAAANLRAVAGAGVRGPLRAAVLADAAAAGLR